MAMRSIWAIAAAGILAVGIRPAGAAGGVAGALIVFNDNGAWCWYQDERVVVDNAGGTLLAASIASEEGVNGSDRNGDVDVSSYELASGKTSRYVLHRSEERRVGKECRSRWS